MERLVVKRALTQAHLQPLVSTSHVHSSQQQQQPQRNARLAAHSSTAACSRPTASTSAGSSLAGPIRSLHASRASPLSFSSSSPSSSALAGRYPALQLAHRSTPRSPLALHQLTAHAQPHSRQLSTSSRRSSKTRFQFLTSYAFAGKPREPEDDHAQQANAEVGRSEATSEDAPSPKEPAGKIGFPADSDVGRWRDALLKGGDAGEDALLCTDMGSAGDKAIAVADGVGGWTESGVDPSLFSQSLMYYASKAAELASADPDGGPGAGGVAPKAILAEAFDRVLAEPAVVAGSATACLITLDASSGLLRSANLGDSGFIVLRQGKGKQGLLYASPPQQLGFNTPLQLAKLPASMRQEGSISNTPRDAATWECTLQHGDLIIVGTDGLFDNVDARIEIPQFARFIKERHHAKFIAAHPQSQAAGESSLDEDREFVEVLATNLVEYAKICQNSQNKQSPFEREAARYGIHFPGGKVDDVALVCCLVIEG